MKKIIYLFIYIVAILVVVGCGKQKSKSTDNVIYVSIAPIKPLVEAIVGDDFVVEVLVPVGASPETFEPTPKQFIALNDARIIFSTGLLDFEQQLIHKVHNQSKVVNLHSGISTIKGSCSHTHHGKHCHHGIDPHIWCSPKALATMSENINTAIVAQMPDSVKYRDNFVLLKSKIAELDADIEQMCNQASLPYFIIYHPALTYIARDYNLEQVAIENEGKEPSAKHIAAIIDRARRDGIKRIFYQSEFPRSSVEIIAEDIGAEAVELNPLDPNIFDNIRSMVKLITE